MTSTTRTTLREVERRLAEEESTAELGVHLSERGGRVVIDGQVASETSHRAVLDLVGALLPGVEIVDQLTCAEETLAGPPRPAEDLR
jgi:hypothetical protein